PPVVVRLLRVGPSDMAVPRGRRSRVRRYNPTGTYYSAREFRPRRARFTPRWEGAEQFKKNGRPVCTGCPRELGSWCHRSDRSRSSSDPPDKQSQSHPDQRPERIGETHAQPDQAAGELPEEG